MSEDIGEKCGIFGIWSRDLNVAKTCFFGLFALQHRGQESSGMCTTDGKKMYSHANIGLVSQVYTEGAIDKLKGHIGTGHNRYVTSRGATNDYAKNIQPLCGPQFQTSLAHNGNLPSVTALTDFLESRNIDTTDANDSKLMHSAIEAYMSDGLSLPESIAEAYPLFTGAFSLLVMSKDTLVAVRDRYGIRPFSVGSIGTDTFLFASETCALETVGAEVYWDVGPGEMLVVKDGVMTSRQLAQPSPKFDVFEFVYFARPDSMLLGKSVYEVRWNFGAALAREVTVNADIVIPVPETGIPSAIGFSRSTGIPIEMGLTKNRYIHRTFIQPDQHSRELGVRLKLTPLRHLIAGKRVVIIDDSIVRGTTSREIVKLLFHAGAIEVHFLVTSPPVRFPDFYGIDTPSQKDLIGAQMSVEEIEDHLGATSLHFLSLDGMLNAIGIPRSQLSCSAFTGEYPIPLLERAQEVQYDT